MKFPLSTIRESCHATLAFFDLFDYPLTLEEIRSYYLGRVPGKEVLESFLGKDERIGNKDGFYFFRGRESLVAVRHEREKIAKKYWRKVHIFLPFIRLIPFIRMVGVCNTLAFNNPTRDSDIDLFIIAKRGRLFFVRFLTVALFSLLGVRRHGRKISRRFCLSLYVDEENLNLQTIHLSKDDIYLPYWILTMKPVYGETTYRKFMDANSWIGEYFHHHAGFSHDFWQRGKVTGTMASVLEFLMKGRIGSFIEKLLESYQRKRHRKKISTLPESASIVVNSHMLKFHNIDRRKEIARKFHERLREIEGG